MNATDIIGWAYESDVHCIFCAALHFGPALHDEVTSLRDADGNPLHPIFASDERAETDCCGDCHEPLFPLLLQLYLPSVTVQS